MSNKNREQLKAKKSDTILIVDDEPLFQEYLAELLSLFGFNTAVAQDGVDAVAQLDDAVFPIVITDFDMPKMNGMQLLAYIKDTAPDTKVIVISGNCRDLSDP